MRLVVDIPEPKEAIKQACPIPLAARGVRWKQSCLGRLAKATGVYVIHHDGVIKYVGKTDGPTMSYGARLRRQFQESASSGKHNYPKLLLLTRPPDIMVSFFPAKEIDQLVKAEGVTLNLWGKVEVFETALIHAYNPEFQRHYIKRIGKQVSKFGIPEDAAMDVLSKIGQG
jgi:hypothetical protein